MLFLLNASELVKVGLLLNWSLIFFSTFSFELSETTGGTSVLVSSLGLAVSSISSSAFSSFSMDANNFGSIDKLDTL